MSIGTAGGYARAISTLTGTLVILRPPSGRSTGGLVGRLPLVFNLIETTSNVGPAGGAGAWVNARDVNAASSSGNTANLTIRMVTPLAVSRPVYLTRHGHIRPF